jgi:CRISPR-associated protein Csb2
MIALGIRYLTGYAAATNLARQQPEWPPHWGRTFMAMAAGHFEGGEAAGERAALEWIEAAPAPALRASDADERSIVRAYVPVNDDHGGILRRARQDRAFPRTRPREECVYFVWNGEPSMEIRAALERLCRKVTRIGHSSSAVQMWVVAEGQEPAPNWLPGEGLQDSRMRVTEGGTLRSLEVAFNGKAIQEHGALAEALGRSKGKQKAALKSELKEKFPNGMPESRRPILVKWQGYGRACGLDVAATVVDGPLDEDFVVLTKFEGMTLGLESTLQLTGALRDAAMKAAVDPPEWLSGHDRAGSPSLENHAAFFPLPYVDFDHADGHVLGLGMALPRGLKNSAELRRVLGPLFFDLDTGEEKPVDLWRRDRHGNMIWKWELQRETRERPPLSLQRLRWTKPSLVWASVMPVVLHHHPKKREGDVERIVREAFVSAQFPEPEVIEVRSVSAVSGAGHAMTMPPFAEGGANLCRYQTHVVARFAQPVSGPMLVGRGRFRGYGLFRPVVEYRA